MALVTQRVVDQVRARAQQPVVINLSPRSVRRGWWDRLARAPVVGLRLVRFAGLALAHRGATVYLALSGGPGQLYEAWFLLLARLIRARIVIHHHNYRYLRRRRLLTGAVFRIAGANATHVVPCGDHERRLTAMYPTVRRTMIVPNAAFFEPDPHPAAPVAGRRERISTVGFLGNVSREKGILEFLEVCRELAGRHRDTLRAAIAGPFVERGAESAVRAFLAEFPTVEYVGPVYDAAKRRFYASIDVLLFPSHEETDPLTIYEALEAGLPVVVLGRGCLPSVLAGGGGVVVEQAGDYVGAAVRQVETWLTSPDSYRRASAEAAARYRVLVPGAGRALERLVDHLCRTGSVPPAASL
jgi:glycosyltransferase involved in cell wall biosynthesis